MEREGRGENGMGGEEVNVNVDGIGDGRENMNIMGGLVVVIGRGIIVDR